MRILSPMAISKLIEAHKSGDEEKFRSWSEFIAGTYEDAGNKLGAKIITDAINGTKNKDSVVVLD